MTDTRFLSQSTGTQVDLGTRYKVKFCVSGCTPGESQEVLGETGWEEYPEDDPTPETSRYYTCSLFGFLFTELHSHKFLGLDGSSGSG